MDSGLKLAVISLAAQDTGHEWVLYPLEHALVYYLGSRGLMFEYEFSWPYYYPKQGLEQHDWTRGFKLIEYPHSLDLVADLEDSCFAGLLRSRRSSTVSFSPGPLATRNRRKYIHRLDRSQELKYSQLRTKVKAALDNPRHLLDACYRRYIREI